MFSIYTSNTCGMAANCLYPNRNLIVDEESFKEAVSHDYVCGSFKNSYRSLANFIDSDCLAVDCDNDHSEMPSEWVTPDDVAEAFPEVRFGVHYSRHHNLAKGDKAARPRFHILFPISLCTDPKEYREMKQEVLSLFPYFDSNAMDAARFFYGTQDPEVELYPGEMNLTEFLFFNREQTEQKIQEGSRNTTMSKYAAKVLKRLGICEEAKKAFLEEAKKCTPLLEREELKTIWNSAVKFYKRISQEPDYIPPVEYQNGLKLIPGDYSDMGQAQALVNEYSSVLAYTEAADFLKYDGQRWKESRQLAVGLVETFMDRQLEESLQNLEKARNALVQSGIDKDLIEKGGRPLERVIEPDSYEQFRNYQAALAYYKFVMKRRELKSVSSVLYLAKPLLLKDIGDFDSHPFLLNTPAGTYDLRTGDFKDHDPEDYLTKVTSVSPGTEGNEIWQETINSIFCHDQELIDYVQQIVGLAAIGKVFVEALIIAYGDGSNGKSTFWNTIARVLGDYSGVISSDLLTVGCKRNPRPEIAELKGKRLAIAAELAEGTRLNTSIMKQLSSTDEVSAEKKYKDPFKFIPTYSVVLYTNHLPKVGTADSGTWRRLIVIPFNAKLSGNKDIKNYADYLVKHAGGAILSWIIEGASKAIQNNFKFNPPKAVEEALGVYRQSNDWMSSFIEECCEVDRSYIQKSGEFYQEYRAYCMRNGEFIRNKADFYAVVDTLGFRRQRNKKGSFIYGIRLKSDFLEE